LAPATAATARGTRQTSTMAKKSAKSELLLRILSTLILLPLVVYLLLERGTDGSYIRGLLIFATFMMGYEFARLANLQHATKGLFTAGTIAIIWWLFAINFPAGFVDGIKVAVIAGLTITAIGYVLRKSKLKWAGVGLIYICVPVFSAAWLAVQAELSIWLLWTFAVVWATDIGAFAVGKTVGGPKLAPKISPNKTWSGFVGGVLLAAGAGGSFGWYFGLYEPFYLAFGAGLLSVWAQSGDMLESRIKRHFGAKDSGYLIPGHGGILDRADGLLFAVPVVALVLGIVA